MWYGKARVTGYELKALKHELKFKSASSNPRVTSWNPQVTSSNARVTSSNPWVTSSNLRVMSSNPRIMKPMQTQVKSLKISSFPKITRNATRYNNRDDLLYVSFTLKISIFSVAYI